MTDNTDEKMDKRRHDKADEIITEMTLDNRSASEIAAQKKANKEAFGHEGEAKIE